MASKRAAQVNAFSAIKISNRKGFTLIELMIVVLILAVLASTAVGAFETYVLRSKTTEVFQGLAKLTEGETVYFQKNAAFLNAGPTNIPPSMNRTNVDFSVDPSWALMNFSFADPIYFGYLATLNSPTSVDCEGQGDLNGDGNTSLFRRNISFNGAITVGGLVIFDELE